MNSRHSCNGKCSISYFHLVRHVIYNNARFSMEFNNFTLIHILEALYIMKLVWKVGSILFWQSCNRIICKIRLIHRFKLISKICYCNYLSRINRFDKYILQVSYQRAAIHSVRIYLSSLSTDLSVSFAFWLYRITVLKYISSV